MELAIVILNWNAVADTVRCIRDISSWKHLQPPVWVVDNASTDGSLKVISQEFPEVHLIRNSTNLGFAGGNNRGILGALSMGDMPILLLSSDIWIDEDNVIGLLNTLKANEQIGCVGPLLYDAVHRDKLLAAGRKDPALHRRWAIDRLPTGTSVPIIVECLPGAVVIVREKVFRQVGLLDMDFFYGNSVADLCLRARQHGFLSALDIRARAFHELRRRSEFRDTLYTYYLIRNRFLLVRKFHQKWKLPLFGVWTLFSLTQAMKARLNGQPSKARAIRLGLHDGLRGPFGRQNKRVLSIVSGATGRFDGPVELSRL